MSRLVTTIVWRIATRVRAASLQSSARAIELRPILATPSPSEISSPSRLGDEISLGLGVARIGRSSIALALDCSDAARTRVAIRQTIVVTSLDTHRPISVPPDLRAALEAFDPALRSVAEDAR